MLAVPLFSQERRDSEDGHWGGGIRELSRSDPGVGIDDIGTGKGRDRGNVPAGGGGGGLRPKVSSR